MTIAFDFDGVIHRYSNGWQDGSIYDKISVQWVELVKDLLKNGHTVFILTTRNKRQIKKYFKSICRFPDPMNGKSSDYSWSYGFSFRIIPFWEKFVKTRMIDGIKSVGICNHKAVFDVIIDDRAICFEGDYKGMKEKILNFKPWIKKPNSICIEV